MKTIKSLGLASVILGVAGGIAINVAVAADFNASSPSWTGSYLGANVGYGWDSGGVDLSERSTDPALDGFLAAIAGIGLFPTSLSPKAQGVIGGGQVGYNWELQSGLVVGLEADLQASGIKGSLSEVRSPQFFDTTATGVGKQIDWFGTVRGRAGYLVNPQWLIYATGGLAYGKTSLNFNTADITSGCLADAFICADQTSSKVKFGWTAGAGVETMLAPNWSVKAEYLYVDLGHRSFDAVSNTPIIFTSSAAFHEQIVRVGLNYHFN